MSDVPEVSLESLMKSNAELEILSNEDFNIVLAGETIDLVKPNSSETLARIHNENEDLTVLEALDVVSFLDT